MSYKSNLGFSIVILSIASVLAVQTYGDNFRVDCGSDHNTTLGNRVFMSDSYASKYLNTPTNISANTIRDTNLDLYKTARIFSAPSSYKFPINKSGRYMLRLYFFPFTCLNYNLNNSKFLVSFDQYTLLSDYTTTYNTVKEYSFTLYSTEIEITIEPTMNSFAYLNTIEFFLLPIGLIQDTATLINPKETFKGILGVALETVYRVNMGGPTISYNDDVLWRTWESDDRFLEHKSLSTNVHRTTAVQYRNDLATQDDAPIGVYGTCRRFYTPDISNANLNITWSFDIDIGFQYHVRFHYCDIISESPYELFFKVFVDSWIISDMFDISVFTNGSLGVPVYKDYVTPKAKGNKLDISIGPTLSHVNNPDAILNGLEIMKINNFDYPFDEGSDLPPFNKRSKKVLNKRVQIMVIILVLVFLLVVSLFVYYASYRSAMTNNNSNTAATH